MTSLLNVIRETSSYTGAISDEIVSNLAKDMNYIKKSSSLVSEALQKGSDITQLANGDILITEVKTITYKYNWNKDKGRFERANNGHRQKKQRKNKLAA